VKRKKRGGRKRGSGRTIEEEGDQTGKEGGHVGGRKEI